jgi:glyoxylase-like metal-dependent hydrolase (beta-lactamase superfamily II)
MPRWEVVRVLQLPVGPMKNFAYLLADDAGEAALVDPAWDVPALLAAARREGIRITHVLATHGHPDHVNGVAEAQAATGTCVVAHASADHPFDVGVKDGDVVEVGALRIRVHHTPGHRFDSVCYQMEGYLVTGDTLFVGECGRVDLPGSDPVAMHRSLVTVLRGLPDDLVVLPGHDYGPTPTSTLGREKRGNYTLQPRTLDEFLAFMAE